MLRRSAFRSKVAARMAAVFFLCAGLPLATLGVLTVASTTGVIDERARVALRYDARVVAQDALGRLNTLTQQLDLAMRQVDEGRWRGASLADDIGRLLPVTPTAAGVWQRDGSFVSLVGSLTLPPFSDRQRQHLAGWGRLIVSDQGRHVLVVGDGGLGRPHAAALLDERWIVGLDDPDKLPPDAAICAGFGPGDLVCSSGVSVPDVSRAVQAADHGLVRVDGDEVYRAWVSAVSLEGQYDAPGWKLVVLRPDAVIRQDLGDFLQNLVFVVILAVLIVAWISMRQVRRQLEPLSALTEATDRLSRQEFDRRVDIQSDDEFEVLGHAFNTMAGQLKQQFADLEAFNVGTLTTLARAIDAKSPWTAGHSERVTFGAVEIARALGFADRDLDLVRKGALVHDVGKIATPIDILDKPARLTEQEERIMQQHPAQGVHILEPIPAFRPLLPIVGQHHEKWDGTGYPSRLIGTSIALAARIVAVADVYDALRSDRPYRAGLPHGRVVEIIRHGAGNHFDPDVVAAFMRTEQRLEADYMTAGDAAPAAQVGA